MSKIYACAFGEDGCTGDSAFAPDFFDTEHSEDWHTLVDLWQNSVGWSEEDGDKPVAFYLVNEVTKDAIEACAYDCGNDSALYAMLRAMKTMITQLAVKKILP